MSKLHDASLDTDVTEQEEMLRADVERELGRAYANWLSAEYDPHYRRMYDDGVTEDDVRIREREQMAIKHRLEEAVDRYRHLERMERGK